jgi:hypothetical protein
MWSKGFEWRSSISENNTRRLAKNSPDQHNDGLTPLMGAYTYGISKHKSYERKLDGLHAMVAY